MLRNYKYNAEKPCKLLLYLVGLAALGGCASTEPAGKSAFMPLGAAAPAPIAFLDFCARRPDQCRSVAPEAPQPIRSQPEVQTGSVQVGTPHSAAVMVLAVAPTAPAALSWPRRAAVISAPVSWRIDAPAPVASATDLSNLQADLSAIAVKSGGIDLARALGALQLQAEEPDQHALAAKDAGIDAAVGVSNLVATAPPPEPSAPLHNGPALLAQLNDVNRRINGAIKAAPDLQTHGVADHWDLPLAEGVATGDCEDYVLEKRRALIEGGLPQAALSIAVVRIRSGENHAVLLVATDGGELVLDNFSPWAMPWRALNYQWIERQAPGQALDWVSIDAGKATDKAA